MALKFKIPKSAFEALPADVKKEYTLNGEEAELQVDGIEDNGALRRAKDRLKQELEDTKKENEDLIARNDKLEKGKAGDVEKLQKRWDSDRSEMETRHKAEIDRRDTYTRKQAIDLATKEVASRLNPKSPLIFEPHVKARLDVDLTGEEPKLIVKDKDGKPSKMTLDDLHKELVAEKQFAPYIVASQASGGAGTGKNNNAPSGGAGGANGSGDGKAPDFSKMNPKDMAAHLTAKKEAAANNQQ